MADLMSWRPFSAVESEMDRLMRRAFGRPAVFAAGEGFWHPPVDIHLTDDAVIARFDLPGVDTKKVEISVEGNVLTVRGRRPPCEEVVKTEKCWYNETARGDFHRVIDLPEYVDRNKVSAAYKNGVLTVMLPKQEEAKPRMVESKAE